MTTAAAATVDRESLICRNLGLVHQVARHYVGRGLDLDDLIGAGYQGLILAADRYDPSLGYRFSTYAYRWIRQSIGHAIRRGKSVIPIPLDTEKFVNCWNRTARTLLAAGPIRRDQVIAASGLRPAEVVKVDAAHRAQLRLDAADLPGVWTDPLSQLAVDPAPDALDAGLMLLDLRWAMSRLSDRDWLILALRYGLGGCAPQEYAAIGRWLGLHRTAVTDRAKRALATLRIILEGNTP